MNAQMSAPGEPFAAADEDGMAWMREALAYSSVESFTRDDMTAVVQAMNYRKAFYGWVLGRFYEVAESGFEFETTTGVKVTVSDKVTDSWNTWRVPQSWEFGFTSLLDAEDWIPVQRHTSDDRGPGTYGATVKFPLDVLFGERDMSERYQQYLSLKAEFENEGGVR